MANVEFDLTTVVSSLLDNMADVPAENVTEVLSTLANSLYSTTVEKEVLNADGTPSVDDEGNPVTETVVTDFDVKALNELIDSLKDIKKSYAEVAKEADKKAKSAKKAEDEASGKKYCQDRSLKEGDTVRYWFATQKKWVIATVSTQKSSLSEAKTLHVTIPADMVEPGKKADRYIHFDKLDTEYVPETEASADDLDSVSNL